MCVSVSVSVSEFNRACTLSYQGVNWIWHVDQYDKLSRYGFCIHGGIDGLSRKLIWLKVFTSNSDPWIIGKYFYAVLNSTRGKLFPQYFLSQSQNW